MARPLIRGLEGRRMFERTLVFLSWRLARTLEGLFGTRRLQPQLRLVVCVAALAAAWAVYLRGARAGQPDALGHRSRACAGLGRSVRPAPSAPPGRPSFTGSPR